MVRPNRPYRPDEWDAPRAGRRPLWRAVLAAPAEFVRAVVRGASPELAGWARTLGGAVTAAPRAVVRAAGSPFRRPETHATTTPARPTAAGVGTAVGYAARDAAGYGASAVRAVLEFVVLFPLALLTGFVRLFRRRPADPLAQAPRPVWRDVRRTPANVTLWLRAAPRWVRATVGASAVLLAGAAVYFFAVRLPEARRHQAVMAGWKNFEEAAGLGRKDGMLAALGEVLAADPADALAIGRKKALETGEADPTDPPTAALTLRMNLMAGNLDAADREAVKRLAAAPEDWMAGSTRAFCALARGDRPAARGFLDALPKPDAKGAGVDPAGLLLAARMFRETGKPLDDIFGHIRVALLPAARSPAAVGYPPAVQLQLIRCYLEPFDPGVGVPNLDGLGHFWAAVNQLADRVVDAAAEAGDVAILMEVGWLTNRMTAALAALKQDGQVGGDQFPSLVKEVRDRGKRAWAAAAERDPRRPEPYHGLAVLAFQDNDFPAAHAAVVRGLTAAPDSPDLHHLLLVLMQMADRPEVAAELIWQAARKHPDQPAWWTVAAEAAVVIGRRDLALQACERARAADPKFLPAHQLEARLWLEAGDPHKALERVAALGDAAPTRDAGVARVYTRALLEAGLGGLLDDYFAKAEAAAKEADSPAALAAGVRGVIDAPPDAARLEAAAELADRMLTRWRDNPDLLRARADALARAAEFGAPMWDRARTRSAVTALERVRAHAVADKDAAAALAWVRLKGEKKPDEAVRDAAPLVAADKAQEPLGASPLEVLGAVYLASGKPADAARVLEKVRRSGKITAGGLASLAVAYAATARPREAATALAAASGLPRTPQQHADYLTAVRTVKPEAP